ncbi:unnamed protein product [Paramecium pentaurelia]|uniref:Uncharacterized protein n=1 Tax=Paramecium pentaurelia TaxID=43138 RepID=A0A8S1Y9S4_9CILI|nr:unnamed protein product [Paramecium pentaurelia]
MKQEFCLIEGHDKEELNYICNELQCIDLKNNKLLCQKCLCQHRGVNYTVLRGMAINNYNQYIQILQSDIDENESLKKSVEQSIKEIQGKIIKMLSDLQKSIFTFVDQQSQKLNINKTKAQQLMQDSNPQLDIYIFFAKFSDKKAQGKQEITKKQVKKIINDLVDDLNQKLEYLKQQDINENKIIDIELQSFQIESIFQPKLPYSYCNQHFTTKSSICIDINCLQSSDLDYHCLRCCKTTHVEHFKNDLLEEYDKLKKEQKIKQNFLVNEKQKIKENIQKLVNDQIIQLKIEQKEQYLKYETKIENIKSLQQQFEINLSVQDTKYVFGDLLLQFITTKEEELQLQLNQVQKNLEEKLKFCKKQDKQTFLEECKLLQIKQDEVFKLQKTVQELQFIVDQKDQLLKAQSSENILNLIYTNTQQIITEKDKQIKITELKIEDSLQQQQQQQQLILQLQQLQQQQQQVLQQQKVIQKQQQVKQQQNPLQQQTQVVAPSKQFSQDHSFTKRKIG